MSLPHAENHFKSAEISGRGHNIKYDQAYFPILQHYVDMARGMAELTRALMEMKAKIDTIEYKLNTPSPTTQVANVTKKAVLR